MRLKTLQALVSPSRLIAFFGGITLIAIFLLCGRSLFVSRPSPYFRSISIDTQILSIDLREPFPERTPPKEEYYTSFRGAMVLSIFHYDNSKDLPYKVLYNGFELELDKRVRTRAKLQELMRGPFGTLYADTTYYYGRKPGNLRGSRLEVMVYANKAEHEPSQVITQLPQPLPPLSAISMVRVLRTQPDYAVVVAVYDPNGTFQRANIFASSGGDWHFNAETAKEIHAEHNALLNNVPVTKKKYGLPDSFPIAAYLESHRWEWNDLDKPNPTNAINLHYDYNRWVRQDVFEGEGKRVTRYLTYVVTPEDAILEPIDRAVPFDQMWPL